MKKWLLLILFLSMNWNSFSQTILQNEEGDTLFCFSVAETRRLVKSIEHGRFCDSTVLFLERENGQLRLIIEDQQLVLEAKDKQLSNTEAVITNQKKSHDLLNDALTEEKKRCRRHRNQKFLATGAGILLGILAIF